ncbi:DUF533 domain-containing protein [Teichococcus oryzae]|uniref:Tellurite resistance TerB family protein n=1 Tax=Teichococcus oryzae TaxID=1608942 RepID=A0A5B2THZ3_9PROT|nr:DUF533 domain-containing protein [Pseudoroseomonas oryzae]KAA2214097.1 tellurite resistance TerB family protein [Pseudoroseomonas oryzae]
MPLATRRLLAVFFPAAAPPDEAGRMPAVPAPAVPPDLMAALPELPEAAARRRAPPPPPYRVLQEKLGTKLLHAWLQNRHQTLFPLALNLRNLDAEGRHLLVEMLAASARMASPQENQAGNGAEERAALVLSTLGGGAEDAERLAAALQQPHPLPELLEAVRAAGLGAQAYVAALLLAGRNARLERSWADYLAARFALPAELVLDLERRAASRRIRRMAR